MGQPLGSTPSPFSEIPPLNFETSRLRLRSLKAEDAQLVFDLYASDPVAVRYMSFPRATQLSDTEAFVRRNASAFDTGTAPGTAEYVWIVELRDQQTPIGSVGFGAKNEFTLVGGYILAPPFWGHGYASEAWSCVVNWAKTQPKVYRIEAVHDLGNPASGKVMQRAGMEFEGILRRCSIHPNVSDLPQSVAMYAWARP